MKAAVIVLSLLAVANAVSIFEVIKEEWNAFKVS